MPDPDHAMYLRTDRGYSLYAHAPAVLPTTTLTMAKSEALIAMASVSTPIEANPQKIDVMATHGMNPAMTAVLGPGPNLSALM